jgi:hypothetical protein
LPYDIFEDLSEFLFTETGDPEVGDGSVIQSLTGKEPVRSNFTPTIRQSLLEEYFPQLSLSTLWKYVART